MVVDSQGGGYALLSTVSSLHVNNTAGLSVLHIPNTMSLCNTGPTNTFSKVVTAPEKFEPAGSTLSWSEKSPKGDASCVCVCVFVCLCVCARCG